MTSSFSSNNFQYSLKGPSKLRPVMLFQPANIAYDILPYCINTRCITLYDRDVVKCFLHRLQEHPGRSWGGPW